MACIGAQPAQVREHLDEFVQARTRPVPGAAYASLC